MVLLALSNSWINEFHEAQNPDANRKKIISRIRSIIKTVLKGQCLFKKHHIEGIIPTPRHKCPGGCHYVRRQGKCVHYYMPNTMLIVSELEITKMPLILFFIYLNTLLNIKS